jgi:hypothetical protein
MEDIQFTKNVKGKLQVKAMTVISFDISEV